ncbi:hypothetical protein H9P43_006681 [Blastocladiella emersonii ATCC 22665]|nr:hypothetical protein H9P43_006681 [Blastocladiella emersonii ATCC 22665]
MMEKTSNPASTVDTSSVLKQLLPSSLTPEERELREMAIHMMCKFKFDRHSVFLALLLDANKPSDQAFIRDYHEWADALQIESIKADNMAWMARGDKKFLKFGIVLFRKFADHLRDLLL